VLRERARRLLAKGGALPSADRRKVLDELLSLAQKSGDAERGKAVFVKQCAKCHVHGEEGTRIGPDLTGIAVHPKTEMLENILDPSRSVEGNFRVYTLVTTGGAVLSGLLAAESATAVELFDAEGKKHQVLREEIEELAASQKSLMPEGFEKQVSAEELVDLLEFLARRGKYLPLPLDKVATAVSTRGMFQSPEAPAERLVFDDWKPKTFAGVPFQLVDPRGDRAANVVLLYGPQGLCSKMPKSVSLPCHAPAKRIHLLGGVSGWGYPLGEKGSLSLIVRVHYADGTREDHELRNGEHVADYIRRVDVPGSQFAFDLHGRQLRYLAIEPRRSDSIERIELVKGNDATAPVVMAVTVEGP
jgi:putative heme-binding domain-containing protein